MLEVDCGGDGFNLHCALWAPPWMHQPRTSGPPDAPRPQASWKSGAGIFWGFCRFVEDVD